MSRSPGARMAHCSPDSSERWSGFDFIPKALAFGRAEPGTASEAAARAWTRRSRLRLPLDLVTCAAMLSALVAVAQLG